MVYGPDILGSVINSGSNITSSNDNGGDNSSDDENAEKVTKEEEEESDATEASSASSASSDSRFDEKSKNIVYIENNRRDSQESEENRVEQKNESEEENTNEQETKFNDEGEEEEEEEVEEVEKVEDEGNEETKENDDELNQTEKPNENSLWNNKYINKTPEAKIDISNPWNKLFGAYKKTSQNKNVNFFRREIQNEYAFKNGLYFTATTAGAYNKQVDTSKYAYMKFPDDTMVLVVTANKFFFQDLIYSSNKYIAIKRKFSFIINNIIRNLKTKLFFKNYEYQFLFRSDSFGYDGTRKLLDFNLLGELSNVTQTIYLDPQRKNRVSMHKLYGGWFHFLGILVVNGYSYNQLDIGEKVEVVPKYLINDFIKEVVKTNDGYNNGFSMGLWRDFPRDKYVPWRFSLELFLWDLMNIMPHELPHPAKLIISYNNVKKGLTSEQGKDNNEKKYHSKYSQYQILNWHLTLKEIIRSVKGLDVVMVYAPDYIKSYSQYNKNYLNYKDELLKKSHYGYIFLLLINKDFFVDEFVKSNNYKESKMEHFKKLLDDILEKLKDILKDLKEMGGVPSDRNPIYQFYNYLSNEKDIYKIMNPHLLGEIAGITKHLRCENVPDSKCTKDVSIHHKYGGWFEFAGAIYIKDVNYVHPIYERHDIIKKEYENPILMQANCSCQSAGLWRDIPEKNMAPYRYPLEVFILENPQFNILNIQDIHPFVLVDLLNKGLHVVKMQPIQTSSGNDNNKKGELMGSEKNEITNALPNGEETKELEENDNEEVYRDHNKNGINVENITNRCLKSEENGRIVNNEIATKGNDNDSDEVIEENNSFLDKEEEKLIEEFDPILLNVENVENNDNENEEYGEEDEYEEMEDNYEMLEGNDDTENKNNDGIRNNEQDDNDNDSLRDSSKHEEGVFYGSEIEEDLKERDNLEDMSDSYEIDEDNKNDLNLLISNKDNTNGFSGKVFIFMVICFIIICIALLVSVGIRLYANFMTKKGENNKMVMDFKDREEIPVVQGIPAPWLNA